MSKNYRRSIGQEVNEHFNQKYKYSCCLSKNSSKLRYKFQLSEVKRRKTIDFPIELINNGKFELPKTSIFKNAEYNKITFIEFQLPFQENVPPSGCFNINLVLVFPNCISSGEYCVVGILDLGVIGEYNGFTIFIQLTEDPVQPKTKKENLNKNINNEEERIKNIEGFSNEILQECENKERIIQKLKEEIEKIKEEKKNLQNINQKQETENKNLIYQYEIIKKEKNELDERYKKKKEEFNELKNNFEKFKGLYVKMGHDNSELRKKLQENYG